MLSAGRPSSTAPHSPALPCAAQEGARTIPPQFAAVFRFDKSPANSALRRLHCQYAQRLLKTLHREDAQSFRIAARNLGVLPCRHEEDINTRAAGSDRLLLHSADGQHRSVQCELAGRRDSTAVRDVAAEHARDLES